MHPFMTLNDDTEIVHSDAYMENGQKIVKAYIERPKEGGFDSAECYLPAYRWEHVRGFSKEDIQRFEKLLCSVS